MKRSLRVLAWTLALAVLAGVLVWVNLPGRRPAALAPEAGEPLGDFRIRCLDGSEFTLSDQRGKVTVINLWATWCGPCVRELPDFDRLQREQPEEVIVLAVHSPAAASDVEAYLEGSDFRLRTAVDTDGSLAAHLGATAVLPQTFIIDPRGVVTWQAEGAISYAELLQQVEKAKTGGNLTPG